MKKYVYRINQLKAEYLVMLKNIFIYWRVVCISTRHTQRTIFIFIIVMVRKPC